MKQPLHHARQELGDLQRELAGVRELETPKQGPPDTPALRPRAPTWQFLQPHVGLAGLDGGVWRRGRLRVISSYEHLEYPDGSGEIGPCWHVSVSRQPPLARPSDAEVKLVATAFGMPAAEEDNHHPGVARHLFCPVDPTRRAVVSGMEQGRHRPAAGWAALERFLRAQPLPYVVGADGLILRCSPVLVPSQANPEWGQSNYRVERVVEAVDGGMVCVEGRWMPPTEAYLDLQDRTGRQHAAWFVMGKRDLAEGMWFAEASATDGWVTPAGVWLGNRFFAGEEHPFDGEVVPGLAALDFTDPRLLRDGSRRVEALVLRELVLHRVATMRPPDSVEFLQSTASEVVIEGVDNALNEARARLLAPITDEEWVARGQAVSRADIEQAIRQAAAPCTHPRAYRTGGVGSLTNPPAARTECPDCQAQLALPVGTTFIVDDPRAGRVEVKVETDPASTGMQDYSWRRVGHAVWFEAMTQWRDLAGWYAGREVVT